MRNSRTSRQRRQQQQPVLGSRGIAQLLLRLARAITHRNRQALKEGRLAFIGIRRRGAPLAERLAAIVGGTKVPVGAIDITLYRDDLQMIAETPIVRGTDITFDINGRVIILVDDVIFTGRTVRAALSALLDYGRPQSIQLAVLVDRGGRELPIQPDFVGRRLKSDRNDLVDIFLKETDVKEGVFLTRRQRRNG